MGEDPESRRVRKWFANQPLDGEASWSVILLVFFLLVAGCAAPSVEFVLVLIPFAAVSAGLALSAVRRGVKGQLMAWFVLILIASGMAWVCWQALHTEESRQWILIYWRRFFRSF